MRHLSATESGRQEFEELLECRWIKYGENQFEYIHFDKFLLLSFIFIECGGC